MMWLLAIAFQLSAEPLQLVAPEKSKLKNPVNVFFTLQENHLYARFEVKADKLYVNPKPKPSQPPYLYDVVEVFVSVSGEERKPYFEYELSPLNQNYTVQIDDPKKPFKEGIDLGLKTKVTNTKEGWIGEMWIPLFMINWDGDPKMIYGNAFAIQGLPGERSFWSLFLPRARKAKFHQPEYFRPLIAQ